MFSIRNLKLRYLVLDLKILIENPSIRLNETTHKLILVDLVDDEDLRPRTDPPNDNARSKEMEELVHSSDRSIITLHLHLLAW